MKGLKRFETALAKYGSAISMRVVKSSKAATIAWMTGVLTGAESSQQLKPPALGPDDLFIVKLLRAFAEVSTSAETLDLIAKLARRSPARAIGVDPAAHLRFFVEAYLNEVYLLAQRCDALPTLLQRAYRKDARATHVAKRTAATQKRLASALRPMLTARGAHVHEFRYDDFDVSRLSTLNLIAPTNTVLARVHRTALLEVRRKKVKWMVDNTRAVHELLDWFFEKLFELVFDETGSPKYPVSAKAG